ncbi:MAG TPA: carbohydrate ABC transporter permease [Clostridiaceae bacterium]|nr:carbohydrate ABC transporter permease [Clostridiaceae bacterium]
MVIKKTFGEKIFDVFNIILMLILVVVTLLPFLHVIFSSFSSSKYIMQTKGLMLWPKGFNTKAYELALENPILGRSYINTIIYAASGTFLGIFLMSMAAYALVKPEWPLKKTFIIMIMITMFFGGGLIPTYINIRNLRLLNTMWVMFLPSCINTWTIMVLRTGFNQVPSSIAESAYMDGANDLIILFKFIMPLSKAVLAVVALFSIVGYWNSWFPALIYLKDRKLYPLQMVLREVVTLGENAGIEQMILDSMSDIAEEGGDFITMREAIKYATITIAIGPIILVYPFLQRYFVKGVMIGSLKG